MSIIVDESLSLSKIELLFKAVSTKKENSDIIIPHDFAVNGFGVKAAMCQVLNTWIRKTKPTSSILAALTDDDASIDNFIEDFGLFLCLMVAKQERKIYNYEKTGDFTQKVFDKAIEKLKSLTPRILSKTNEKIFIGKQKTIKAFCFDHSANDKFRYNEWFYQAGILLNEAGFNRFYVAAVKHLLAANGIKLSQALQSHTVHALSGIIKELFENTDKHGRHGFGVEASIPLNPNMRGVFMEVHSGDRDYFSNKVEFGNPLYDYFNNPHLFASGNVSKTFLEISVLDSGSGFAQRKSGIRIDKFNAFVERELVIECLTKYDTTASKRGLKRVASYLGANKGFYMLRTGTVCIYWDFLLHSYQAFDHQYEQREFLATRHKFLDWDKKDNGWTKLSPASGSLITIFFPLE